MLKSPVKPLPHMGEEGGEAKDRSARPLEAITILNQMPGITSLPYINFCRLLVSPKNNLFI